MSKLENKLNYQIEQLTTEFEKLKKEKKDLELQVHTDFVDTQGSNNRMLEDLEALFEKKLATENQKYFELEMQYEKLKVAHSKEE